jgi:hypothetical protein
VISLPRTLNQLSGLGTFSAITMGIAVLLAVIFSGIQSHPAGFTAKLGEPIVTSIPVPGTTFVLGTHGVMIILTVLTVLIRDVGLPEHKLHAYRADYLAFSAPFYFIVFPYLIRPLQFIAEMKEPRDFPKGLTVKHFFIL